MDNPSHQADVWQKLYDSLPETVSRKEVGRLTGGLVSSKTLTNADWRGDGPAQRLVSWRKVAYPKAALVDWLRGRFEVQSTKGASHV